MEWTLIWAKLGEELIGKSKMSIGLINLDGCWQYDSVVDIPTCSFLTNWHYLDQTAGWPGQSLSMCQCIIRDRWEYQSAVLPRHPLNCYKINTQSQWTLSGQLALHWSSFWAVIVGQAAEGRPALTRTDSRRLAHAHSSNFSLKLLYLRN